MNNPPESSASKKRDTSHLVYEDYLLLKTVITGLDLNPDVALEKINCTEYENVSGLWKRLRTITAILRQRKEIGPREVLIKFGRHVRGRNRVTDAGRRWYRVACRVVSAVNHASVTYDTQRLSVAASEGIATYLLPPVLAELEKQPAWQQTHALLELRGFDDNRTDYEIADRRVDLALAWDGYKRELDTELVTCEPIGEPIPIALIYHASHPMADEFRKHKAIHHSKLSKLLQRSLLLHPRHKRMRAIARELAAQRHAAVEGFPGVVNVVRLGGGVGLLVGWDWLLRQLSRELHIHSTLIDADSADSRFKLQLRLFESKDRDRHPLAELLCETARMTLIRLAAPPLWMPNERGILLSSSTGVVWNARFASTGRGSHAPHAEWREGTFEFFSKPRRGAVHGKARVFPRKKEPHKDARDFNVRIVVERPEMTILQCEEIIPEMPPVRSEVKSIQAHALFCLSKVLQDNAGRSAFVGIVTFHSTQPTAGPVIVSRSDLTDNDCTSIAQSDALRFLTNVDI